MVKPEEVPSKNSFTGVRYPNCHLVVMECMPTVWKKRVGLPGVKTQDVNWGITVKKLPVFTANGIKAKSRT
jgi:hypothetical protein